MYIYIPQYLIIYTERQKYTDRKRESCSNLNHVFIILIYFCSVDEV